MKLWPNPSLRTRLALLAALAVGALLVALFVAWRLARTTETFTLRQAEFSLNTAARNLVRDVRANPNGLVDPQPLPPPALPKQPRGRGNRKTEKAEQRTEQKPKPEPAPEVKPRSLTPRETTLWAAYSEPMARLTALALYPFPETAGGLYTADGELVGSAFPDYAGTGINQETPDDLKDTVAGLADRAVKEGQAQTQRIRLGDQAILLVTYPTRADNGESADLAGAPANQSPKKPIIAVWTMTRLSHLAGATDRINLIALVVLLAAIIGVVGFAFATVRQLQKGVVSIETGLSLLTTDLARQMAVPNPRELARIARAINDLAENLRSNLAKQRELETDLQNSKRLAALGRVVAGVAHEVRNPLTAMKLKLQIAQRAGYTPSQITTAFRILAEEIERLDVLVRRLLELGRPASLQLSTFDLGELARRRASLFSDLAEREQVEFIIDAEPGKLEIEADEARLAQVIDNLIQNALEALESTDANVERKTVRLSCAELDDGGASSIKLVIEDSGPGIALLDIDHIFEPFYSRRDKGTGLGLAIAREIIEVHNGSIRPESQPAQGARFVIVLPKAQSVNLTAARMQELSEAT